MHITDMIADVTYCEMVHVPQRIMEEIIEKTSMQSHKCKLKFKKTKKTFKKRKNVTRIKNVCKR